MNEVFRDMLRKPVLVFFFFYNILIYSPDWKSHIMHLTAVLDVLKKERLVANRKKCYFSQTTIEYLGHVISKDCVAMDSNKVKSVIEWPVPKNVKRVCSFLRLTGYYRKFIKDYGKLAPRPLTDLTKNDGFKWGDSEQLLNH